MEMWRSSHEDDDGLFMNVWINLAAHEVDVLNRHYKSVSSARTNKLQITYSIVYTVSIINHIHIGR